MKDSGAASLFKVVGALHFLVGLLYLCIAVLIVFSLFAGEFATNYAQSLGYEIEGVGELSVWLFSIVLSFGLFAMYFVSAYGFLKMKKWQPYVFTVIVVLSILEFVYSFVTNGLTLSNIVTVFFFCVWVLLLGLVWSKRHLFNK